ncbi:Ger(x)C family spore germination protein [Sporomusa sphaeroides DSM 2875]|jgi:spore germination protein KC|uniref:Ger(x)C family spore germination protein n=1 Tax=Sporomusa sphaeroides TaxID=47679 RepID=UPI00202FBA85|nr:Ger(x)C family spore germination protein [Sporomusa sphaeroides]MCM0758134.1 Ger(x)C family spore germination protein [Sporomusa sphaeroides DSM 2875]
MKIRILLSALLVLLCLPLSGCWNYWGLDEMSIVTGMAIDKDEENGPYLLTLEIADTRKASKDNNLNAQHIEAEGDTIFNAIRNAKRRLNNKLYGGHMKLVIISQQLAEREGVLPLLENLMRDGETRETLSVAIAQSKSAKEIMLSKTIESAIISYDVHQSIEEDSDTTAATRYVPLYKAYSAIKAPGNTLVLPALHQAKNSNEQVIETNGIALFRSDRLIGWLSPEKTMYYLLFKDEVHGGAVSCRLNENQATNTSLEIKKCKAKTDYRFHDRQLTVTLKVKIAMNLMEANTPLDLRQAAERARLEERIAAVLTERISDLFVEAQTVIGSDIFGLGNRIYKDNPSLWQEIEGDWDSIFKEAKLVVEIKVDLVNAGVLKGY